MSSYERITSGREPDATMLVPDGTETLLKVKTASPPKSTPLNPPISSVSVLAVTVPAAVKLPREAKSFALSGTASARPPKTIMTAAAIVSLDLVNMATPYLG
jgi:hypothetical protein